MSVEESKVGFAWIVDELLNGRNLRALDELVHPDFVDGYGGFDREHYGDFLRAMFEVFPDIHVTIEDIVGEGNAVVARLTLTGTHQGEFLSVPATGRRVEFAAIG